MATSNADEGGVVGQKRSQTVAVLLALLGALALWTTLQSPANAAFADAAEMTVFGILAAGAIGRVFARQQFTEESEAGGRHDTSPAKLQRVCTMRRAADACLVEVSDPLTSILVGADAGLRWLDRDVADVAQARAAIQRVRDDALRAVEIVRNSRVDAPGPAVGEAQRLESWTYADPLLVQARNSNIAA